MGKLVMGYWDCPFCGNKGVAGNVVNCPACGRARGDVQFYVKGYQEGTSLREEELQHFDQLSEEESQSIGDKPDWYCSFCNSLNSNNAAFCSNCGASRADSESNYFDQLKKKQEKEAAELAAQQNTSARPASSRKPLLIAAAIILVIIGVFVWMNGNKTASDLKVSALNWVRVISIEENRMFSESGWELPTGAKQTGTRREIHHYDSVLDHYKDVEVQRSKQVFDHYEYELVDNGNGTFSKVSHPEYRTEYYTETVKEPVYRQVARYATKYYYNIWRWVQSRNVTASGEDHQTAWPEYTLGENEREGQRSEAYRFTVEHTGKNSQTTTYQVDEEHWKGLNIGDPVFITSKRSGANPYLSDEKGNHITDLKKVQ